MKRTNNKRSLTVILAIATVVVMLVGSFAYFTDRVEVDGHATAGTVDISINNQTKLTDDEGKDILNPGDMRVIKYTIKNEGNKSVDLQEQIYLSVDDSDGWTMEFTDTDQAEFELYDINDVELVEGQGYKPKAGVSPLADRSYSYVNIEYYPDNVTLNGNEDLNNDEREIEDGITSDSITKEYALLFKGDVSNKWQGCKLRLDILVQAKQHRNTEGLSFNDDELPQTYITMGFLTTSVVVSNDNYEEESKVVTYYFDTEVYDTEGTLITENSLSRKYFNKGRLGDVITGNPMIDTDIYELDTENSDTLPVTITTDKQHIKMVYRQK